MLYRLTLEFLSPIKTSVNPTNALIASDTLAAGLMHAANLLGLADRMRDALVGRAVLVSSVFSEEGTSVWGQVHAAVHRITSEANPFVEAHMHASVARCWAAADKQSDLDLLLACLRVLGESGLGGGRSRGCGRLLVRTCTEVPEREGSKVLVSVAVPSEAERQQLGDFPCLYVNRTGYTEEVWRGKRNSFKKGIWAIPEMTEIPFEIRGSVTFFDERLFHYGHAMYVVDPW